MNIKRTPRTHVFFMLSCLLHTSGNRLFTSINLFVQTKKLKKKLAFSRKISYIIGMRGAKKAHSIKDDNMKLDYTAICTDCQMHQTIKLTLCEKLALTLFKDNLIYCNCKFCGHKEIFELQEA